MNAFERDQHDRESLRPHVAAAIDEGLIELPAGEDVDTVLENIRFVRGVPTGAQRAAPVMRDARCMLCSCSSRPSTGMWFVGLAERKPAKECHRD